MVTDEDLLRRSLEGDASAFGALVERHESAVCAVSFAVTGDRGVSEDVAQDAFVAAWKSLATLRDPARFRAWACGIARNLANKARAVRGRIAPMQEAADSAPNAEELLDDQDREAAVWASLERLSPTYREPLVLFYREGRSTKEVAEALGLTVSTVEQRLSRGRKQLRAEVMDMVEQTLEDRPPPGRVSAAVVAAIEAGGIPVGGPEPASDASTPAASSNIVKTALIATATIAAVGLGAYALSSTSSGTHATEPALDSASARASKAAAVVAPDAAETPRPAPSKTQAENPAKDGLEKKSVAASEFEITRLREDRVALATTGGKSNLSSPLAGEEPKRIVAHIDGTVVDADGRPVANAVVLGGRALSMMFAGSITAQAGVYSGDDGRFSLPVYQTDDLLLMAAHHEHGMSVVTKSSSAGTDVELRVESFAWLVGSVKEGSEAVPARVFLRSEDHDTARFAGKTEDDGSYRIGPVPPGDYTVGASTMMDDPGNLTRFPEMDVSLVAGRSVQHDVVALDESMIVLEATLPEELDIKWITLAAFEGAFETSEVKFDREDPFPGKDATAGWVLRGGVDSHDGDVSFQGLKPGTYTACISVTPLEGEETLDCTVVELGEKAMEVVELHPVVPEGDAALQR